MFDFAAGLFSDQLLFRDFVGKDFCVRQDLDGCGVFQDVALAAGQHLVWAGAVGIVILRLK